MLGSNNINYSDLRSFFFKNTVFPHIRLQNFLENKICEKINNEIENKLNDLQPYFSYSVKKYALNDINKMGYNTKKLIEYLNSNSFLNKLEDLTGIKNLIADPRLEGAGIHIIKRGGYLKIHTDFYSHIINETWERKINLLLYFNKNFKKEYNGNIELFNINMEDSVSYMPDFNTAVIFITNEKSYHGHPKPLNTPENIFRKSIALYYYVDKKKKLGLKETTFKPLKTDSLLTQIFMKIEQYFLRFFSFLKRKKIINDYTYTNFVNFFKKKD